jgi:hypothetical protein
LKAKFSDHEKVYMLECICIWQRETYLDFLYSDLNHFVLTTLKIFKIVDVVHNYFFYENLIYFGINKLIILSVIVPS